jgi:hypothetical protein
MPASRVSTFTDADEYAAVIRNRTTQVTVTKPGVFNAKYVGIDLHTL